MGTPPKSIFLQLFERDQGRCVYCGMDLKADYDRFMMATEDHLVPGSKETRIVANLMARPAVRNNVLVVGHPYVDVWQAIKPSTLGIPAWPVIPRSMEWKLGILKAFGWPHSTAEDIGLGWQRLLSRVNSYSDLEPSLLGRVEEVIDFLTVPVS